MIDKISTHRAIIMEASVRIEEMVTNIVCLTLGIDKTISKVFGQSNSALSFNTKIEILREVKYFETIDKSKFGRFAEIRNKFAHLRNITTITECISSIDGLDKNFQKWYPDVLRGETDSIEKIHYQYIALLLKDIESHILKFTNHFNGRIHEKFEAEVKKNHFDILVDCLADIANAEFAESKDVERFASRVLDESQKIYKERFGSEEKEKPTVYGPIL